jgi:monoterpene epsilon-lactone hydrolase
MVLSPEMASLLDLVRENPVPRPASVTDWRAAVDAQLSGPLVDGTTERTTTLGSRAAALIHPTDAEPEHTVLYLHGGAYEVGSIDAYRAFASRLALRLDATVAVLDYRLAPEHPFPAAVEDATAAYRELLSRGINADQIVVMGDSAGGGLTVATLIALLRESLPSPAAAVCLSPWADLTMAADSYTRCSTTDPFLDRDTLEQSAQSYLAGADPRDPLASPVCASSSELGALAPLLVQAAAGEVLADDAATLAANIAAAGGAVELELWPDLTHVWHLLGPGIPEARDALDRIAQFADAHWR